MLDTGTKIMDLYGFTMPTKVLSNWPDDDIKYFRFDEEIGHFADQLISKFKPELSHINIAYLFKKEASKKGDGLILGTAGVTSQKVSALAKGVEAVIEISYDQWIEMSGDQKLRLVFHELCHIAENEKGKVGTVEHDVTEFVEVVRIFGPASDSEIAYLHAFGEFSKNHGGGGLNTSVLTQFQPKPTEDDEDSDF